MLKFIIVATTGDKQAYEETNVKIDRLCQWFCCAMLATLASIVIFPLFYFGGSYYILNFGVKSFYLYPPTEFVSRRSRIEPR